MSTAAWQGLFTLAVTWVSGAVLVVLTFAISAIFQQSLQDSFFAAIGICVALIGATFLLAFFLSWILGKIQSGRVLLDCGPFPGKILSLVIVYEIQDIKRFPKVQDFTSYARLIRPKKTSAGKCYGSGNGRIGNSYLKWAFSEAVVLFLRETREVQPYIRRMERKYGKDKAKGIVAHRLGRTVYYMLKNTQVFDIKKFVNQ